MAMAAKISLLLFSVSTFTLTLFSPNHAHPISEAPVSLPFHHPLHYPPAHSPHHHHHHHANPPSHAPVYPPHSHGPSKPPSHPPTLPPSHYYPPSLPPKNLTPRSFIAVQGVVYCKSCKYAEVDTLWGATPIAEATVKLVCKNTKYDPLVQTATTDKKGYFFVNAPKTITSYAFHKCRVFLASSPSASCKKPSVLHGGLMGGALRPEKWYYDARKHPYVLYSVGPFAFEPSCPR